MKIGLVLDDSLDRPDGVQQYVRTLAVYYQKHGHEVHFLVGETKEAADNIHSLSRNIHVGFNANRMSIPLGASRAGVALKLHQLKLDILHVQMPYHPLLAGRVLKSAPPETAVVGTFHILPNGRLAKGGTKLLGKVQRRTHRLFDAVVSVSPAAQQFASSHYGLESTVIPNAVELKHFIGAKPVKELDDGKLNIVFLGRLVKRKGAMWLIKAVEKLHQESKISPEKVRFVICGKGPLDSKLRQYALNHDIAKYFEFTGFLDEDEKPRYLAAATIAVFPSTGGESFGIVLVEAMAAGAGVVIGGDNPGYASVLGDQPETLFDPTDTPAFAVKLEQLINDNDLRKTLHAKQQEQMLQYDVDIVGKRLLEVYREAMSAKALAAKQ